MKFDKLKNYDKICLSENCKSVILGSILGNGSLKIDKCYKNTRLKIRHSETSVPYLEWKLSFLEELGGSVVAQKSDGFSKNKKILYQSKVSESLTMLHKLTYANNNLCIKRSWLNRLTPLALAIWWLDDGSLISGRRRGVFCCEGFQKSDLLLIIRYFKIVLGIELRLGQITKSNSSKEYFRLYLNTSELKKFLLLIAPHIQIKTMLYKIILFYKDESEQQRWTSAIKEKLPQFSKEIDSIINNQQKMI